MQYGVCRHVPLGMEDIQLDQSSIRIELGTPLRYNLTAIAIPTL